MTDAERIEKAIVIIERDMKLMERHNDIELSTAERTLLDIARGYATALKSGDVPEERSPRQLYLEERNTGFNSCRSLMLAQIVKRDKTIEKLCVQLSGCGVAALGYITGNQEVNKGDYGYSESYQDVKNLWIKYTDAQDKVKNLASMLEICEGAIKDAIYCEDGLDGATGEELIEDIEKMKLQDLSKCLECDHLTQENLKLGAKLEALSARCRDVEGIAEIMYEENRNGGDEWEIAKANVYIYERWINIAQAVSKGLEEGG